MAATAEIDEAVVAEPNTTLRQRLIIYFYIGFLYFAWPFSGVWGTKARFILKDDLGMSAQQIALFLLLIDIPAYIGFAFGFIRDRWSPFQRRDQGLLILFCGLTTGITLLASGLPKTYVCLFALFIGCVVFGQFVGSAMQGLTAVLGQVHLMSGRLSSLWQAAAFLPGVFVALAAGKIAASRFGSQAFLIGGCIGLAVTAFTFWRPGEVYGRAESAPVAPRRFKEDALGLVGTRALYPIVALLFLWNFTPGVGTPIQFYLTNTLHGNAYDYGKFNALMNAGFIPGFLLYGVLCTRLPYRPLLWICTFIAVPQITPLLIVHNTSSAMVAAVPMGVMGGPATAAYFDLLIRACPKGLHGTAMMLGSGAWALSAELGNVAGASLFDHFHSFAPCAWATVLVYACLIPVMCFVPRELTLRRDGEAPA